MAKRNYHPKTARSKMISSRKRARRKLPWIIPILKRPNFRFYRITITIPKSFSKNLAEALIFCLIYFQFIGGFYNVLEKPRSYGLNENNDVILIYPHYIEHQFLLEGIIAGTMIYIGFVGLLLLEKASQDPHDPSKAQQYVVVSIFILYFVVLVLNNWLSIKKPLQPGE